MALQLRAIEAFMIVADELSYTRAAAASGMSEAVLSKTIRSLERELDAKLFRRGGPHGLVLTDFGRYFLERTPAVARARDELFDLAGRLANGTVGDVTIGWAAHGLGRLGVAILQRLAVELPDVRILTVHPGPGEGLDPLDDRRCDLLVVRDDASDLASDTVASDDPRMVTTGAFAVEQRVVGVAVDDRLAPLDDLPLDALLGRSVIPSGGCPNRPQGDFWGRFPVLDDGRPLLRPATAAATVDELFTRVRDGEGVCLVPDGLARFYEPSGIVFVPAYDLSASFARLAWRARTTNAGIPAVVSTMLATAATLPMLGGLRTSLPHGERPGTR